MNTCVYCSLFTYSSWHASTPHRDSPLSNDCFLRTADTVTIQLPAVHEQPIGTWTAVVPSCRLARLSDHIYSRQNGIPDQGMLSSIGELPSRTGQQVQKHCRGMQVDSILTQGGTITGLMELITGTCRMHAGLSRMHQLMRSQQQHIRRMSTQQLPRLAADALKSEMAVKVEPGTAGQQHGSNAFSAAESAIKQELQVPEGQLTTGLPIKADEPAEPGTAGKQLPVSGRQRQQSLSWHVLSSGVVQSAEIGLTHAVLQVLPPPPWSAADSSLAPSTTSAVKQESPDTLLTASITGHYHDDLLPSSKQASSPADVVMQGFDTLPRVAKGPSARVGPADGPARGMRPSRQQPPPVPTPYLTLCIRWQLTSGQLSVAQNKPPEFPDLPQSTAMPAAATSQQQAATQANRLQHEAASLHQQREEAGSVNRQATPSLRCCITSHPALPQQVLESFQDMAGMLNVPCF